MGSPGIIWKAAGRQGPASALLDSRLFESIVGKSTAVCDWALGKGTEWPGELTEALWDLFDFLDVVVELCLRIRSCSIWETW